jgi:hypothetical protein
MAVHREYGKLICITCDWCADEFNPEWEEISDAEDLVSLDIAITQAESYGWEKAGHMLYCIKCAKEKLHAARTQDTEDQRPD